MQTILRPYFNNYQVLDEEQEIEKALREARITRKIGNPQQKEILRIMLDNTHTDFTINEIANISVTMGGQISTVSARMSELRVVGLLIFSQRRISRVTLRTNDAFKLVPNFKECVEILDG